jgi:hypothetical protein
MKSIITFFAFLLIFSLSLVSCSDVEKLINGDDDPNTIGGSTEIPINTVGNSFGLSIKSGGKNIDINEDIKVTKNEAGVLTIKVNADLSKYPELAGLISQIPKELISENNKINTEIKIKSTSEGIQDNFNADEKFFTIAKYDCKVGDTYTYTNSNGKKLVRKVTKKSTTDDFYNGIFMIKVIEVEQEVSASGIDKFIYRVNHKFGFVDLEILLEDGSKVESLVTPSTY